MAKYESINMDPKLIRKGGRKAPKMTIKELKNAIVKYANKNFKEFLEENLDEEYMDDAELIVMNLENCEECPINNDVYPVYMENYIDDKGLSGFHTLDNGFSFYGVFGGPDYDGPSFYIVYYDGKKLRGYVPRYGNTVIVDCQGFECSEEHIWKAEEKHYKKWFKSPLIQALTEDERNEINKDYNLKNHTSKKGYTEIIPLKGPIKFEQFKDINARIAYRIANGYPWNNECDIDWEAIKEDIKNRIEVF